MVRVPAEVPLAHSHILACPQSPPGATPGYNRGGLQSAHTATWVLRDERMHKSSIFFPVFLKGKKKNQLPMFFYLSTDKANSSHVMKGSPDYVVS